MTTSTGTLVVELLTRAHRAGFVLEYLARPQPRIVVTVTPAGHDEPELQAVIAELRKYRPDVLDVLTRSCTVRTCHGKTWAREYGTGLAWCHDHAATRGLTLLHEEHPDLFPDPAHEETAA